MKVRELKALLDQYAVDETIIIANYSEDGTIGNTLTHLIEGVEYYQLQILKRKQ